MLDYEVFLKALHARLLSMMKDILNILDKEGIKYYLAYGTFLGAVRHKGFIPWDDDVDIHIDVHHWKKFKKVIKNNIDLKYSFIDPDAVGSYSLLSKIVLKDSYMSALDNSEQETNGIWIDFFKTTYANNHRIILDFQILLLRVIQKLKTRYLNTNNKEGCKKYITYIINIGTYITISFFKLVYLILGNLGSKKEVICEGTLFYDKLSAEVLRKEGVILPARVFSKRSKYKFEDSEFYGCNDYDGYLSARYTSDYMTPVVFNRHIVDYHKVKL